MNDENEKYRELVLLEKWSKFYVILLIDVLQKHNTKKVNTTSMLPVCKKDGNNKPTGNLLIYKLSGLLYNETEYKDILL